MRYYTVDLIPANNPKFYRCVGYVEASDIEDAYRAADRWFPHSRLEVTAVKLSKNQPAAKRQFTRQVRELREFFTMMAQPAGERK